MGSVSIKDVAKRAGVATGTVSRVLNNKGYVSNETRQKIEAAIKELNYIPNEIARSFQRQSSSIIALILPQIHHPLFSEFAFNLESRLNESSYKLMVCNSHFEVEKEMEFIDMLKRNVIDGIVMISNSDIDRYITPGMPIVAMDRHFTNEHAFVTCDNYQGGVMAAEKLIEAGCQLLAYVGGFPQVKTEVTKRKEGFINTLEKHGRDFIIYEEPDTIQDEERFVAEFADKHPEVDGVFTLTDMLGYKLVHQYKQRGIAIPEQVQIIGFDGFQTFGMLEASLSTIRQPIDQLGALAADRIIAIINGESTEKKTILPVTYIRGKTTTV